jgi:hypothetical protein
LGLRSRSMVFRSRYVRLKCWDVDVHLTVLIHFLGVRFCDGRYCIVVYLTACFGS